MVGIACVLPFEKCGETGEKEFPFHQLLTGAGLPLYYMGLFLNPSICYAKKCRTFTN